VIGACACFRESEYDSAVSERCIAPFSGIWTVHGFGLFTGPTVIWELGKKFANMAPDGNRATHKGIFSPQVQLYNFEIWGFDAKMMKNPRVRKQESALKKLRTNT